MDNLEIPVAFAESHLNLPLEGLDGVLDCLALMGYVANMHRWSAVRKGRRGCLKRSTSAARVEVGTTAVTLAADPSLRNAISLVFEWVGSPVLGG